MAKIIKYKFLSAEINHGTEANPDIEQILLDASIECKTQADFDANYPIAEKEAVGGIIVEGEFDPDPIPLSEPVTWDELDMAYINGINSL
jgi:hypothetical protein